MVLATFGRCAVLVVVLGLIPASVLAQGASTATIAGVVKDSSGAVLPGVTVEATSPALIENVRSTVTDGRGQYLAARVAAGRVHRHVLAPFLRDAQARGPRTAHELHGPGGRRAHGQPTAGDHHGLGFHAAGGRAERDAAAHGLTRAARHGADGEERARHRRAHSCRRRAPERSGRRRQQGRAVGAHHRARRQDVRFASAAGWDAIQRADAWHRQPRGYGPRLLRQPAGRSGGRRRSGHDGIGRVPRSAARR